MNTEQLKTNAAAMIALANGKKIESQWEGGWSPCPAYGIDWNIPHRPKPEPISRPWSRPDDVPGPVCWIRYIGSSAALLIIQIDGTGLCAGYSMVISSRELILWGGVVKCEYSTDRKTWRKCEVVE